MTEPGPVSFSLLAAAVSLAGPVLGPYALIVFAAAVGSALALSVQEPMSRWQGLKFLAMGALIALLITGPLVWAVEKYLDVPANIALVPVAFALGAARNQLLSMVTSALGWFTAAASAASNARRGGGQ